jgi:tetratricopeptide (TPR) repeat protein
LSDTNAAEVRHDPGRRLYSRRELSLFGHDMTKPSPTAARARAPAAARPLLYVDLVAQTAPLFATALRAHRRGQLGKARSAYLELTDQPRLTAVCLHQLGVLAGEQGDHKRAAELLQCAIRLDPGQPLFIQNLATSLEKLGDRPAARAALIDLGCLMQKADRHEEAIPVYRRILAEDPNHYGAHVNLGTGFGWLNDARAAIPLLLRGIALHAATMPQLKPLLEALLPRLVADGIVSADIVSPGAPSGRLEMIEHPLTSLGKALTDLGYDEEALRCHRLSAEIEPGFALAHWNMSLVLLSAGDFAAGWKEYEWRWRWDKFPDAKRVLPVPEWRGEPLEGKTIVVYSEQGYGDTIQFAPLARRLAEQAGEVLLEVTTPQVRLFQEGFARGNLAVIERTRDPNRVATAKPYHYTLPLISLPAKLGLGLAELPLSQGGYITPPARHRAPWKKRLAGPGLKVGLAWLGRKTPDHRRSIPLAQFRPLFAVKGVAWHALQRAGETGEIRATGLPIADWSAYLEDFADTAALIAELDLVISIDTAAAHLAGAIAKPVLIMLVAHPDWRWLRGRDDCPWYPTARLFRQPQIGDWDSVIAEVARALAAFAKEVGPATRPRLARARR